MLAQFWQSLKYLLPSGFAWPRHENSVQQRWLAGVAASLAELHDFCNSTAAQWLPHRTCSRTGEWEAALSLPDGCTGAIDDPVLAREHMLARLRGVQLPYTDSSPAAPGVIEQICREAGYAVTVTYHEIFRTGRNRTGDRLGRSGVLHIHYPQVCVPFRAGLNHTTQRLSVCPPAPVGLQCLLDRIVPARFQLNVYA